MKTYAIDFETEYSKELSITIQGTHRYIRMADIYMVSIVGPGIEWVGHPQECPHWDALVGQHLVAHNMSFDGAIINYMIERDQIPAGVGSGGMDCTADMSVYFQGPRNLAGACKQMLGNYDAIDKSMRSYMKGRQWHEVTEPQRGMMLEYALKDSLACLALWDQWHEAWPQWEKELSRHNRTMAWRGVNVDTELSREYQDTLERVRWEAEQEIPWNNDTDKILSREWFDIECRRVGLTPPKSLAKTDDDATVWFEKHKDLHPFITAVGTWRQANTLLAKVETLNKNVREDGKYSPTLKYYGASVTGRYSGDAGFNMQNLPRDPIQGVDLRKVFIPTPGNKFIVVDLSQIEPRCMAWYVKDERMLDMLREGYPLYEAHARATMGFDGPKGSLKENKELDDVYRLAKAQILGLGYMCGAPRFVEMAWTLARLRITLEKSKETVGQFRHDNPLITEMWSNCNQWLIAAASDDRELEFALPSGRELRYFDIDRIGGLKSSVVRGDQKKYYQYGGKVAENIIQGMARDVMCAAILRIEKAGYPVVFHVHDEVIVDVPMDTEVQTIIDLMTTVPDWAEGLPVDASGFETQYYKK